MCAICDFKIDFDVDHPKSLTVAVATRAAIDTGTVQPLVFDGPLGSMKLCVAAIDALKTFQRRLEAALSPKALAALPDFYMLLIESGTWGFFRPTETGFDSECSPTPPRVTADAQSDRDIVFITSETAIQPVLEGKVSLATAFEHDLIVLDASAEDGAFLHSALLEAFPAAGVSRYICH